MASGQFCPVIVIFIIHSHCWLLLCLPDNKRVISVKYLVTACTSMGFFCLLYMYAKIVKEFMCVFEISPVVTQSTLCKWAMHCGGLGHWYLVTKGISRCCRNTCFAPSQGSWIQNCPSRKQLLLQKFCQRQGSADLSRGRKILLLLPSVTFKMEKFVAASSRWQAQHTELCLRKRYLLHWSSWCCSTCTVYVNKMSYR